MSIRTACFVSAFATALAVSPLPMSHGGFTPFVIRNATDGSSPTISNSGGVIEIAVTAAGQKAAVGSSDIDGTRLGDLGRIAIERLDDISRFNAGSGPAVAPYLNFWITDGTNFAVAANEPSNPAFQPLFSNGYDLTFADLSDKVAKIYENADKSWLPNSGQNLTFADLANFTILAPQSSQQTWTGLGSGAPIELGTNKAYGVNWVFGDTLSNYVSDQTGYQVQNPIVAAAVPEPGSLAIACGGVAAVGLRRRRRRS